LTGVTLLGALETLASPRSSAAEVEDTVPAVLDGPGRLWAASVRWENDLFGGTDEFYTNGVSLGLSHTGPSWIDPAADLLPWSQGRRTVGYDIGQAMFTPSDTSLSIPDPDDRPYAGILALGLALHVDREDSYHGLKFITGVVGPASLAEETQEIVHDITGSEQPEGWDAQLQNELILNLAYEYRHRFRLLGEPRGWSLEAIPVAGGWLGNMLTQVELGAFVRWGYNFPDDSGPTFVRGMDYLPPPRWSEGYSSTSGWGFSVYGGIFGNLVLRDITLDGNTFEDSPSVDKNLFVPAAGVGLSLGNRRFQLTFTYAFLGEEFEDQPELSRFGTVACSLFF
jgi:hypothetical protein